jgi:methylated-DNA-protein-cysteine methyltransferase related protein
MTPFTARTIEVIRSIPEGKVMTYGQVAAIAGSPRAARQVVRILHSMSKKYNLPWHRVVNAQGEVAVKDEESNIVQRMMLKHEGVVFKENKVDLQSSRFSPDYDHFEDFL